MQITWALPDMVTREANKNSKHTLVQESLMPTVVLLDASTSMSSPVSTDQTVQDIMQRGKFS